MTPPHPCLCSLTVGVLIVVVGFDGLCICGVGAEKRLVGQRSADQRPGITAERTKGQLTFLTKEMINLIAVLASALTRPQNHIALSLQPL